MVADLAALAWIQSRMVFFVAAAFGWDPLDPMRPAELLVLQGVYDDPYAARAALDGTGTTIAEAYVGTSRSATAGSPSGWSCWSEATAPASSEARPFPGSRLPSTRWPTRRHKDLGRRSVTFYGGPGRSRTSTSASSGETQAASARP